MKEKIVGVIGANARGLTLIGASCQKVAVPSEASMRRHGLKAGTLVYIGNMADDSRPESPQRGYRSFDVIPVPDGEAQKSDELLNIIIESGNIFLLRAFVPEKFRTEGSSWNEALVFAVIWRNMGLAEADIPAMLNAKIPVRNRRENFQGRLLTQQAIILAKHPLWRFLDCNEPIKSTVFSLLGVRSAINPVEFFSSLIDIEYGVEGYSGWMLRSFVDKRLLPINQSQVDA